MRFKVSAKGAVNFLRWYTYLAFSWPLPTSATEFQKKRRVAVWALSLLNSFCLVLALLYSIYKSHGNSFEVTTSVCYTAAISAYTIQAFMCHLDRKRIQSTILELERFLKTAEPHELRVFENYVEKSCGFYSTIIIINFVAGVSTTLGPIFLSYEKLPMPGVYPFSIDSGFIKYLIYIHQAIAAIQASTGNSMDCQTALLVWFAGAKLEILAEQLPKIRNRAELCDFIRNHQNVLRLADDAANGMSYIAFMTATCCCVIFVSSCLQLVGNSPIADKSEFLPLALVSVASIYATAWPANNLIETCHLVGKAAYNNPWVDMSMEMRKNVLIILQRSQRPVVASIAGFIPALSLNYYGCFVSAGVSYFMTLRAIVHET